MSSSGVALSSGAFAERRAGEAQVDLQPARASLDDALAQVCARFDLSPDDCPGLREAWAEKMGPLTWQQIASPSEVLVDALGNPELGRLRGEPELMVMKESDWGNDDYSWRQFTPGMNIDKGELLVIRVHTRNGGGNREAWGTCEEGCDCSACVMDQIPNHPFYLHDCDDDFDRTYADIFFHVPPGTLERYTEAVSKTEDHREQSAAQQWLERMREGQLGPWRVLASSEELSDLDDRQRSAKQNLLGDYLRNAHTEHLANAGLAEKLLDGTVSTNDRRGFRLGNVEMYTHQLVAAGVKFREASEESGRLGAIRALIPTLPVEVQNFLDAELPEKVVETWQKTGHGGNRLVKTKYRPETEFQQAERRAASALKFASGPYNDYLNALARQRTESLRALSGDRQAQQMMDELEEQQWAAGWTGDPDRLPPKPVSTDPE